MSRAKSSTFNYIMAVIFAIFCFLTLYPFIYAFLYSISDGLLSMQKNIVFLPAGFTLQNYRVIFLDDRMLNAAIVSIARTVLGTALFLIVTGLCAYSMSKSNLKGRKFFFIFFVIPMYVSGGLLPYYVVIHDLGLMNNFLVYILPTCYGTFFMLLIKIYFESIPASLEESATLDGASDLAVTLRIYLPLSKPVIATVALFAGVGQWNAWFDALLFVSNKNLQPLQLVLQTILKESQINSAIQVFQMAMSSKKVTVSAETYKMAILIITTLPIVFVYPFAQKYFVKGMMIGAIKL